MMSDRRHSIITTPIGELTLVASGDALVRIYFPDHWTHPDARTFGVKIPVVSDPVLAVAEQQLAEYFCGERSMFELPLETRGNAFQERIWSHLKEIPYGETVTYGELAQRYGDRKFARLVGKAVGQNPLSIVVPCHRVVGKNGKLTGYAGGLERKQALLEIEGIRIPSGNTPDDARQLSLLETIVSTA